MCAFKDAYTTEILGHYVSGRMDVSLVQKAFNNMMENHKDEFPKNLEVYCHSDQGSQYLSTSFGTTSRKSTSHTEISLLIQLLFT